VVNRVTSPGAPDSSRRLRDVAQLHTAGAQAEFPLNATQRNATDVADGTDAKNDR